MRENEFRKFIAYPPLKKAAFILDEMLIADQTKA